MCGNMTDSTSPSAGMILVPSAVDAALLIDLDVVGLLFRKWHTQKSTIDTCVRTPQCSWRQGCMPLEASCACPWRLPVPVCTPLDELLFGCYYFQQENWYTKRDTPQPVHLDNHREQRMPRSRSLRSVAHGSYAKRNWSRHAVVLVGLV